VMAAYFANMVTWTLGANKSAVEAASAGELPKLFGSETRRGTPLWAYLLTGIVSTVVLLVAGIFIKNQNSLYYAVFAASSVIFLLPYLLMFPAVIRLRRIDAHRNRPFQVPGGKAGLWVAVVLATASVTASLVLFLWTPGAAVDWSYTGPLIAIVAGAVIAGEILVAWCLRQRRQAPPADAASPKELGRAA
jgi:glutamate:GABA antiporter